ncbi:peptidylprolyl isomerase [Burkholderia pseudomallei]|uniref:peptidylprolyl isomerase n=1 Tax=Burkholderia pseudomallei TaxID=28450 RepID=UPI000978A4D0|nr:peptidyl-prolyl cis-trans isomerase [Burkholderia pseudomallei]MBM5588884.1 peptidyl-prolyl cis-trans isomerase [Burkholderia pseudomallei]MBM5621921.1 peptidyl-prolyl cis-trans isomerase [Burkholderia pseudomallei]MBM5690944.1 peptidyl-prolyl cis-trans isomerase [Burkholderia pseudomallei]
MKVNGKFHQCAVSVVFGILATTVNAQQGKGGADAFATVNDVQLYRSQLEAFIKQSGLPDTDATRAQVENDMISGEVVRQAAEKANYGDRKEVAAIVQMAKAKAESELYLRDNVKVAPVSDSEVKARYDAMVAGAGRLEYKPQIISVNDDATAGKVLAALKQGHSFDDLARQYSVASNRAAGGAMGWVTFKTPVQEGQTQGVPLPMAKAMANLKAGEYTQTAVALGDARVIIKMNDVRPTRILSYDEIKSALRQQLEAAERQKATDTLVQQLLNEATVHRN